MCRYAFHAYADHFACFRCRKAFKQRQWEPNPEFQRRGAHRLRPSPREVACPDCSLPMTDMGLDFKAPPKDDRRAWRIMEILASHGITFHGCGCFVGFRPPRRLREVPSWLASHRQLNRGEALSKRFEARRR